MEPNETERTYDDLDDWPVERADGSRLTLATLDADLADRVQVFERSMGAMQRDREEARDEQLAFYAAWQRRHRRALVAVLLAQVLCVLAVTMLWSARGWPVWACAALGAVWGVFIGISTARRWDD